MSGRSSSGVSFSHLQRLSDSTGLFEHALLTERRLEHGYCVDDVARGLVVTTEPAPDPATAALAAIYQRFLASARDADGGIRNRLGADLMWEDSADVKDCWGRALWGLGTAAARSSSSRLASEALTQFETSAGRRSRWTRAMAFAALGAAEVLTVHPDHGMARALLADAASLIDPLGAAPTWPAADWHWPEGRLRYANAVLPETLLAAGHLLDEPRWVSRGLDMLGWLLDVETAGQHPVTPAGGWSRGEPRPGFDQQPIEVAALADACARAHDITGHPVGRRSASVRRMVRGNQRHRDPDGRPSGAATTASKPTAATRTKVPSPRWPCSRHQPAGRLRADDRTGRSLVRSL